MQQDAPTNTAGSAHEHNRPARGEYFRSVAAYWERLYEDKHLTAQIYQERKDITLGWIDGLPLPASARVLDLGCGAGYTSVALAQRGHQVTALDCEPAMLDMALRRAQEAGISMTVSLGDAHDLPFAESSFDLVLALGLIPWLHAPHKALGEMRRVLKPGGFLVLSSDNSRRLTCWLDPIYNPVLAPFRHLIKSALRRHGWMRMPDTTPPLMQPTREFDCWLAEAGFDRIQSVTIGFGPFTLFRHNLLPDHLGVKLHGLLQRMVYAKVPVLRNAGAHYLVAATNGPSTGGNHALKSTDAGSYDVSTPVVILGANTHGSLGIMRSLGRMGVPIHAVYAPPRGPASFSAYCRSSSAWDFARAEPEDTASYLLNLSKSIGRRSILIPTWDEMAVFTAEFYDVLNTGFIYPRQPYGLPQSLCSKKEMARLARQFGVPTPGVAFPRSLDDILEYIETARFPVLLKGIDGNRLKERTGKKMVIAYSPRQVREMYQTLEDPEQPNLMLQEYIPGGDDTIWMFNGYFNAMSECLLGFTGRKLRQTPIHTGMTSLGICQRNDVVAKTTKEFVQALGYRGILDIGYRYDARDGQYKVLDVNPRIGATFRLFVADNGIDVARALYLDLTGQVIPPSKQREGRKWFVESDFKSCFDYYREGSLTFRQWLRSLRGIEEAGYFAWDDLAPLRKLGSALLLGLIKARWSPGTASFRSQTTPATAQELPTGVEEPIVVSVDPDPAPAPIQDPGLARD